jgi:hypothetical protein
MSTQANRTHVLLPVEDVPADAAVCDVLVSLLLPLTRTDHEVAVAQERKERLVTCLGNVTGGPRDLLDVHVAALEQFVDRHRLDEAGRGVVLDARLLAVEMMGLVVDHYGVGQRRRFLKGHTP